MDIFGIFEKNVNLNPDKILIEDNDYKLTYREVDNLVNYYAQMIYGRTGGKRTRILLYLNHTYKIIIAILAVLKTGNSYVPVLVSDEKNNKLKNISKICDTKIIITDNDNLEKEWKIIKIDD
ncbi:AMP-binding protein, partial [Enterococcus cecorum]